MSDLINEKILEQLFEKYLEQETFDLPSYEYNNGILTINNYKHGLVISAPVAV